MRYLTVRNTSRNVELGRRVRFATSFMSRAIGLLLTPSLQPGEGMYFKPCRSIHTFFMRYPIDVLFLDEQGTVLEQKTLRPWKTGIAEPGCQAVLELMAGSLSSTGTKVGDRIQLEEIN